MPEDAARRDYVQIHQGAWRLWLHSDFRTLADTTPGAAKYDGVRGPFLKIPASQYARVFKASLSFSGQVHQFYIKQYLHRSPWDIVKHILRPSRGMRAFRASLLLQRNGFFVPPVVAVGEDRRFVFCTRSFLLTSGIENARPLYEWVVGLSGSDAISRGRRRALVCELGHTIGRMHALGICHGDLRPGNVLAEEIGGKWTFHLLDNERTRRLPYLPRYLRIKNLVQIGMVGDEYLGYSDRMRFFREYLRTNPRLHNRRKNLAAAVVSRTRQRLAGKQF